MGNTTEKKTVSPKAQPETPKVEKAKKMKAPRKVKKPSKVVKENVAAVVDTVTLEPFGDEAQKVAEAYCKVVDASKKATKKPKAEVAKVKKEPVEAATDAMMEEEEATQVMESPEDVQTVGAIQTHPSRGWSTFDGGIKVGFWVQTRDNKRYPFHSVRSLALGLKEIGGPEVNIEGFRAFIRRQKCGSKSKPTSFEKFSNIVSIVDTTTGKDLLSGRC
jgi:hypothetical protein